MSHHAIDQAATSLGKMFVLAVAHVGDGAVSEDLIASILWGAKRPVWWRSELRHKARRLPIDRVVSHGYVAYRGAREVG